MYLVERASILVGVPMHLAERASILVGEPII